MNQHKVGAAVTREGGASGERSGEPGRQALMRTKASSPQGAFDAELGIRDRFVPALQAGSDEPGLASNVRWAAMQLDLATVEVER